MPESRPSRFSSGRSTASIARAGPCNIPIDCRGTKALPVMGLGTPLQSEISGHNAWIFSAERGQRRSEVGGQMAEGGGGCALTPKPARVAECRLARQHAAPDERRRPPCPGPARTPGPRSCSRPVNPGPLRTARARSRSQSSPVLIPNGLAKFLGHKIRDENMNGRAESVPVSGSILEYFIAHGNGQSPPHPYHCSTSYPSSFCYTILGPQGKRLSQDDSPCRPPLPCRNVLRTGFFAGPTRRRWRF